ncbi:MAG: hypothetical protein L3J41_10140 [Melioribacteraceae bacterium]|nr:hypothetical protein [Melioribacteraceae bacterium]
MNIESKIFENSACLSDNEIINYRLGKTSDDELHKIESHLIDCPLCSDAVEGAEMLDANSLKDDLSYIREIEINNISHFRKYSFIYSAVAVITIIAVTALLNIFNQPYSQKLFNRYFEVYPDVTVHTRSSGSDSILAEAMLFYNSGNFDSAVEKLDEIKEVSNEQVDFYKGVSLLVLDKPTEASEALLPLTKNKESNFYNEANWYIALAYLKLEKNKEAISHLNNIKESYDYSDRVNEIITEINVNE